MSERLRNPKRLAAFKLGLSAEGRVALLLTAKGYRVLVRRWKSLVGEVDLVIKRGRLIVFVEVNARDRLDKAAEAVILRQRRCIVAGAEAWLAAHPEHAGYDMRFDAVLVAPGRLPQRLVGAFEVEN